MLGIGLKISNSNIIQAIAPIVAAYQERVLADGGNIDETTNNLTALLNQLNGAVPNFTNTCKLFVAPHLGNKSATGTGATAGNRAAAKIYNIFGSSGDLVQATAASQPLLLVHSGTNYVWFPAISGNAITTPNVSSNDLTGNMWFESKITPRNISGTHSIIHKNYIFRIQASKIRLNTNQVNESTVNIPYSENQTFWIKAVRNGTTIQFFTKLNDSDSYTQLGSNITDSTGAMPSSSNLLAIGAQPNLLNASFFEGIIHFAQWGITDGTPTQIFNPQLYNRSASQTTIPSSTGEVWTLNTPGTNNGLKAVIVDKTMIMGNGTSYGMQAPSFNLTGTAFTRYTVFRKFVNTSGSQIINELGSAIASNQGLYLAINVVADNEEFGINAGGLNNSRYTSNSVLMKVATSVANINNADESTPYLINNSAQVLVAKDSSFNNTSPMNATGYNLLARNNASSLWANASVFADLIFDGEHDSTTRTNVFNILKTYFNLP